MGTDNNKAKPNSQVLRDKLNISLKQRLGRKAEDVAHAASDAASDAAQKTPTPTEEGALFSTALAEPSTNISTASSVRAQQFLEEIETEAQREVDFMDTTSLFNFNQSQSPLPPPAECVAVQRTREVSIRSTEVAPTPTPTQDASLNTSPTTTMSDSKGLSTMQDDDSTKSTETASLRDLLKSSKSDSKPASALKAPRQSTQITQAQAPETNDAEVEPSLQKKDTYLKSPTRNKNLQSETQKQAETEPQKPPHEQEILDAIRLGDASWIVSNADFSNITQARQEIVMIFALPQPQCIQALITAGIQYNPKDGLAVKNAIAKKHYAALEIFKTKGARIDLETLKALANWRRAQQKQNTDSSASLTTSAHNATRIQEDFDQFLKEHGNDMSSDDYSLFSTPGPIPDKSQHSSQETSPSPLETPVSDSRELFDFDQLSPTSTTEPSHLLESIDAHATEETTPAPLVSKLDDARDSAQPDQESHPNKNLENATQNPIKPISEPLHTSKPAAAPTPPTKASQEQHMAAPTPQNYGDRKPSQNSGTSAMDKARLAMLDKIMLEKQQLEMKFLELQMYADAASSWEDERDLLIDDLASTQEEAASLRSELDALRNQYQDFDETRSQLENKLAQAIYDISNNEKKYQEKRSAEAKEHNNHIERLVQAERNISSLLKESEKRESDLRSINTELGTKLSQLETREAPPLQVIDWLAGTEKETSLRKHMFIKSIVDGDHKVLDKISKNTAVESELAHLSLIFAAESGQTKCAQWLVENMDVHPGFGGEIALLRALDANQMEMVQWLNDHGANIHHADEFALRHAVAKDNVQQLDILVRMGANPRAANERALREAATEHSWSCFKALLGYGCSGHDDKGNLHKEIEEVDEAQDQMKWLEEQRKILNSIDPDFLMRKMRQ